MALLQNERGLALQVPLTSLNRNLLHFPRVIDSVSAHFTQQHLLHSLLLPHLLLLLLPLPPFCSLLSLLLRGKQTWRVLLQAKDRPNLLRFKLSF